MKQPLNYSRPFTSIVFLLCFTSLAAKNCYTPTNLSIAKSQVVQYYKSGCYEHQVQQVANQLIHFINHLPTPLIHQKYAIVFDIDDTLLSSWPYMEKLDFGYDYKIWNEWIQRACFPPIRPMLNAYNVAKNKHLAIFLLTGRNIYEKKATIINLQRTGYTQWTQLILAKVTSNPKSYAAYRISIRKQITKQGYTIIADIGDQDSDIAGPNTGKCFKIPNPFYQLQ